MTPDRVTATEAGVPGWPASRTSDSGAPASGRAPLDQLAQLHDESVETARLANILGRTPGAAAVLLASGAAVVAFSAGQVSTPMLAIWGLFVAAAAIAMLRLYRHTLVSAFELLPLRAFVLDLHAVLLYAGFAWGAGAFLALPAAAGPWSLALFSAGAGRAIGALLRSRNATFFFLVPAAGLPMMAALFGAAGILGAGIILGLGLLLAGIAEGTERLTARRLGVAPLTMLTLS